MVSGLKPRPRSQDPGTGLRDSGRCTLTGRPLSGTAGRTVKRDEIPSRNVRKGTEEAPCRIGALPAEGHGKRSSPN
jgi:hypothetical protein